MVSRWRWVTVAYFSACAWVGCGESTRQDPEPGAGTSGVAGRASSEAGEGGVPANGGTSSGGAAQNAGRAGTSNASAGSSSGRGNAGSGGRGASAGSSNAGTTPLGGEGGAGETSNTGGTGLTGEIPSGWTCLALRLHNDQCDCGCGVPDPECESTDDIEECDDCSPLGGCSGAETCPGRIDPDNTAVCLAPAEGWTCAIDKYGDETSCDCGCGAHDPDCRDETLRSCDTCGEQGACSLSGCPSTIIADDNAHCLEPEGWLCELYQYGDGLCNCGCGALDRDCPDRDPASCEYCPQETCSCDDVDPADNTLCTVPGWSWTCDDAAFGDGVCDCGCGYRDRDCDSREVAVCQRCNGEGACQPDACPGRITEDENHLCTRPELPTEWRCADYLYADNTQCDCGCGARDLDCMTNSVDECDYCPGCTDQLCESVDPDDATQCD